MIEIRAYGACVWRIADLCRKSAIRHTHAAVDAILAEHPSSIGTGKVLPKSTTDDDETSLLGQPVSSGVADRSETYSYLSAAGEQSLTHLDVARHSDTLVTL
jgi:hypothetical protein